MVWIHLSLRYLKTKHPILLPNTFKNDVVADSCIQGDFRDVLEYVSFWQDHKNFSCKELVEYNSNLCHYEAVQKYCCASCSVNEKKGECIKIFKIFNWLAYICWKGKIETIFSWCLM